MLGKRAVQSTTARMISFPSSRRVHGRSADGCARLLYPTAVRPSRPLYRTAFPNRSTPQSDRAPRVPPSRRHPDHTIHAGHQRIGDVVLKVVVRIKDTCNATLRIVTVGLPNLVLGDDNCGQRRIDLDGSAVTQPNLRRRSRHPQSNAALVWDERGRRILVC